LIILQLQAAVVLAHPDSIPLADVKFEAADDVKCLLQARETGDPDHGPSTWILKAPQGCLVPWHHHSAQEELIVVQGLVLTEMSGEQPARLGPGGFATMASKISHQFKCVAKTCVLFVSFDRAYDVVWETRK
jgi:anti-sigma factor ChrR (cupin superfamily)